MKNNCYSILKFVNNPISGESIAIGLIAISNGKVYLKTSLKKIDFAKSLNKKSSKLLDFSLKQFENFIENEIKKEKSEIFFNIGKEFNNVYLNKLSNYHNGVLQFTKPFYVNEKIDGFLLNIYYEKFVTSIEDDNNVSVLKVDSILKKNLLTKIHIPLKNKIDIDYTIHKKELPTLFFDFDFDAIGVNGSIYALKAVDINAVSTSNPIERSISEYESIIGRLNEFAELNKIPNKKPGYYLMIDKYTGNKKPLSDLYDFIAKSKMPQFEIISSDEGDVFKNTVIDQNAQKLSKLLLSA